MDGDINIFDPHQIRENGNYEDPARIASGMEYVLLGGKVKLHDGQLIHGVKGTVIRR